MCFFGLCNLGFTLWFGVKPLNMQRLKYYGVHIVGTGKKNVEAKQERNVGLEAT